MPVKVGANVTTAPQVPKSVFIFIRRDGVQNMYSLFKARKRFFNDINKWYSFKPPEYPKLVKSGLYEQLAGQVFYTNKGILDALESVPSSHKLLIDYESLCDDPKSVFNEINNLLDLNEYIEGSSYSGPTSFVPSITTVDPEFDFDRAQSAMDQLTI